VESKIIFKESICSMKRDIKKQHFAHPKRDMDVPRPGAFSNRDVWHVCLACGFLWGFGEVFLYKNTPPRIDIETPRFREKIKMSLVGS
jgi:hypothetical protein